MSKRHVMVDIETAGSRVGSAILSVAAVDFGKGWRAGPSGEPTSMAFFRAIDLWSSLMHGLTVDQGTLDWWRKQPRDAQLRAQAAGMVPLPQALADLASYLGGAQAKNVRVWAKGPDFDLVMLQAAYRAAGLEKPWAYRHTRDVRTILAMAGGRVRESDPKKLGRLEHDPVDDAILQAEAVMEAYVVLGVDMDQDFDKDDIDINVIQRAAAVK